MRGPDKRPRIFLFSSRFFRTIRPVPFFLNYNFLSESH